jgi:acetyl esterase/lipase
VAAAAPAESDSRPRAYTYRTASGRALSAHVFLPPAREAGARASAILLFHGGGWSVGEPQWTFDRARAFANLGMVSVAVQYRLSRPTYGKVEPWQEDVTPIEALADACAAFAWIRDRADEFGIDRQRVAGYGVSAGGHLAASAATVGCPAAPSPAAGRSGPDALVLWSPALDLSSDGHFKKLLQGRAPVAAYSPVEHVGPATPPTSIVQGAKDTLTPLAGAQRYCDRLRGLGVECELNVYEGVGHLLTRNLGQQERDFDPDPKAAADGAAQQRRFLEKLGFIRAR